MLAPILSIAVFKTLVAVPTAPEVVNIAVPPGVPVAVPIVRSAVAELWSLVIAPVLNVIVLSLGSVRVSSAFGKLNATAPPYNVRL